MKKFLCKLILIFIALYIPEHEISAQRTKSSLSAGEQRSAEKGLKDNRYFFYFINSSITNLGTDLEKKMYKEAIQRDIIAQILYMKFSFHESFVEIRKSQQILIGLYRLTLKRDIKTTKKLLNNFARSVINSKDHLARHYLKLGYRDATTAKIDMTMADHYRKSLYSMRLYKYVRAIKKAKHGKRYAFFSIIESKTPIEKKKKLGLLNFDKLKEVIIGISEENREYYTAIHMDNYYRSKEKKSFYDKIWEKPELNEIKEYKGYLEKY